MTKLKKYTPQMKKLAIAIRTQRKKLKLTQKQLGDYAGCGVAFIYLLESGKTSVRMDKVCDVLTILGLQLKLEIGKELIVIDSRLE